MNLRKLIADCEIDCDDIGTRINEADKAEFEADEYRAREALRRIKSRAISLVAILEKAGL